MSHQRCREEIGAWMLAGIRTPESGTELSVFPAFSSSADRRGGRNSAARAVQKPGFLSAVSIFALLDRSGRGATLDPSTICSAKLAYNSSREQYPRLWDIEIFVRFQKSKLILLERVILSPCYFRLKQARGDTGCKLTPPGWKVLVFPPQTWAESVQSPAHSLCCELGGKSQPPMLLLPSAEHDPTQPCPPDSSTFQFFRGCSHCL